MKGLILEEFNPARHDERTAADLVYSADEELNALVFGDRAGAIEVVTKCMNMGDGYFAPGHFRCAVCDDELVGVLVDFPVREKAAVDAASGRDFSRAMGFWSFLRKMPLLLRMTRITAGEMDEDGHYIQYICVDSPLRGRGLGTRMLDLVAEEHGKLYLHANIHLTRAQTFYEKNGFQIQSRHTARIAGREVGTCLMKRE